MAVAVVTEPASHKHAAIEQQCRRVPLARLGQ